MKKPLLLLLILLSSAQLSFAQALPDSLQTYVVQALDIMRKHSINKQKVEWEALYAETLAAAKDAQTIRDTYPAINDALKNLKLHHSKLYPAEVIKAYKEMGVAGASGQKMPMPTGTLIDGKYALITVPGFSAITNEDQLAFVDSIQNVIRILDAQQPKGWIIDLRQNQGGNLEPTIAGLMPILGEGKTIGWADADNKIRYANYKNGMIVGLTDSLQHFIKNPYAVKKPGQPVSVLVSSRTSSSGEMAAICFKGRKLTKIIGTPTLGLTTSNSPRELSDGAWLNLTDSNAADRTGKIYGKKLLPDIELKITENASANSYLYLSTAIQHIDKPKK